MAEQIVIDEKYLQLSIEEPDNVTELVIKDETVNLMTVQIPGPPGPAGVGSDSRYTHTQVMPSSVWTVNHNLGKFPGVKIVDSAGTVVRGKISYLDDDNLTCEFSAIFSGKAFCN